MKHKVKNSNEYGSARFSTLNEIKKNFKSEKINNIKEAVIPTCSFIAHAKKKRSVFITDPKGEIFNTTSQMFRNNGYKIITIDFRQPELSTKINILEPIINEYEKYIEYEKEYDITKNIEIGNNFISYNDYARKNSAKGSVLE